MKEKGRTNGRAFPVVAATGNVTTDSIVVVTLDHEGTIVAINDAAERFDHERLRGSRALAVGDSLPTVAAGLRPSVQRPVKARIPARPGRTSPTSLR